ncbi:MAG: aldehyde ferredoxin oxidoreductase C-terminal domain-containing protein [Nitrososphaerales archaeon]
MEYETAAALVSLCMNDNLVVVAKANELCNKYSIDTGVLL